MRFLIVPLLAAALCASAAEPSGIWTYHTPKGNSINRLFDGKKATYLISYAQAYHSGIGQYSVPWSVIHVYDKQADEFRTLSKSYGLADNVAVYTEYNPAKEYLLTVYNDGDIDLVYDNGTIVNVPGLAMANNVSDKRVNSVTFAPEEDKAYLATNFGYLTINDKKGEINDSRIYHHSLKSVAESGDYMLALDGEGKLYKAPLSSPRMNWADFSEVDLPKAGYQLLPLAGGASGILASNRSEHTLYTYDPASADLPQERRVMYNINWSPTRDGYYVSAGSRGVLLNPDASITLMFPEEQETSRIGSTFDGKTFWFYNPDNFGIYSRKAPAADSSAWGKTSGTLPTFGPRPFQTQNILLHPSLGYIVANIGIAHLFPYQGYPIPLQISTYDGSWHQFGLQETNPGQQAAFSDPTGIAIDPDNPNLVYFGSLLCGLFRMNLSDPNDVLHLSYPNPDWKDLPGFVKVHEQNPDWKALSALYNPVMDSSGNLWMCFNDYGNSPSAQLWVWDAASRQASRNAASFRPLHHIPLRGVECGTYPLVLPLKNLPNTVVFFSGVTNGQVAVLQHQGTFDTTSDDLLKSFSLNNITDSDGQKLNACNVYDMFEDTETGLVWMATDSGVFTFSPRSMLAGNPGINQIKVSRNDGTGLADYLLNQVTINKITSDSRGRKWIATTGAGLICVSKDGREIIMSCTTDNSPIPSNNVYSVVQNPGQASMLVATEGGLAEYRPYNVGDGTDFEHIRVYPNPVRPEYLGYVTIDGLADNAIVKITDSQGHLVRELGFAANGIVRWDVADMNLRRVGSGVYFVLASSGPDDKSMSKVSKILVVN